MASRVVLDRFYGPGIATKRGRRQEPRTTATPPRCCGAAARQLLAIRRVPAAVLLRIAIWKDKQQNSFLGKRRCNNDLNILVMSNPWPKRPRYRPQIGYLFAGISGGYTMAPRGEITLTLSTEEAQALKDKIAGPSHRRSSQRIIRCDSEEDQVGRGKDDLTQGYVASAL